MINKQRLAFFFVIASILIFALTTFLFFCGEVALQSRNRLLPDAQLHIFHANTAALFNQLTKLRTSINGIKSTQKEYLSFEGRFKGLQSRLEALKEKINLSPKLISPFGNNNEKRPRRFADVLFSIDYYTKVILDLKSTSKQRARAMASLAHLPSSELRFSAEMRDLWLLDVYSERDSESLEWLATVFAWVKPKKDDDAIFYAYCNLLGASSSTPPVRFQCVFALEQFAERPECVDLLTRTMYEDTSIDVREAAELVLSKMKSREKK